MANKGIDKIMVKDVKVFETLETNLQVKVDKDYPDLIQITINANAIDTEQYLEISWEEMAMLYAIFGRILQGTG